MTINVVYGAPCSGKSTYIKEQAQKGDLLFDYDRVAAAITPTEGHDLNQPEPVKQCAFGVRANLVAVAAASDGAQAYVSICWPSETLESELKSASAGDVVYHRMNATRQECLDRLAADDERPEKDAWAQIINDWWDEHGETEYAPPSNRAAQTARGKVVTNTATKINLNGYITSEKWYDDEFSPQDVAAALEGVNGDVVICLNSYGGECTAATQMRDILRSYNRGTLDVLISGVAASAATFMATGGHHTYITPGSLYMIHDPATLTMGNIQEHKDALATLQAYKDSILNCYVAKCKEKKSRDALSSMMSKTTWMDANAAVENGLCDEVREATGDDADELSASAQNPPPPLPETPQNRAALMDRVMLWQTRRVFGQRPKPSVPTPAPEQTGTSAAELEARLNKLKY